MSLSTKLACLSDIRKTNTKLRLHSTEQRKKALRIFKRQGILAPIIVDEQLNILDGKLRFEIAQELGWKSLNCVILRGLSEVQKKELSKMERTSVETITRNLPLSSLKPDQIEGLLKGQHTPDLSVAKLIKNPALL